MIYLSEDTDRIWQNVTECDRIWQNVTECDRMWQNVTEYDGTWQNMTECDRIWQKIACWSSSRFPSVCMWRCGGYLRRVQIHREIYRVAITSKLNIKTLTGTWYMIWAPLLRYDTLSTRDIYVLLRSICMLVHPRLIHSTSACVSRPRITDFRRIMTPLIECYM